MEMTIAYGYDRDTGIYTGTVNAWESPLEQGVFLLPANATFEEPPTPTESEYVAWVDGSWNVLPFPAPIEPEPPTVEDAAVEIRRERNGKLNLCDWTQLADVPMTTEKRSEWISYRQLLREIPQQEGFPNDVQWPTEPI